MKHWLILIVISVMASGCATTMRAGSSLSPAYLQDACLGHSGGHIYVYNNSEEGVEVIPFSRYDSEGIRKYTYQTVAPKKKAKGLKKLFAFKKKKRVDAGIWTAKFNECVPMPLNINGGVQTFFMPLGVIVKKGDKVLGRFFYRDIPISPNTYVEGRISFSKSDLSLLMKGEDRRPHEGRDDLEFVHYASYPSPY
ncbi:MAG: hypothetical protein PHN74_03440 [Candidatus Pacebacteria bacterium]|nr:hypothetical protein [Candidatus Paceibacterota bacterium]